MRSQLTQFVVCLSAVSAASAQTAANSFCDAVVALTDIIWRRVFTEFEPAEGQTIPNLNPVALLPWYTSELSYDGVCDKLELSGFASATRDRYTEVALSDVFGAVRQRSEFLEGCNIEDPSKAFILANASRLARHVTLEEIAKYFTGCEDDDSKLAQRILLGTALSTETQMASVEVVYKLVEVICPTLVRLTKSTAGRNEQAKPSQNRGCPSQVPQDSILEQDRTWPESPFLGMDSDFGLTTIQLAEVTLMAEYYEPMVINEWPNVPAPEFDMQTD